MKKSNSNPIPGAIAAQVARGVNLHKAIAMTGVEKKSKPSND